ARMGDDFFEDVVWSYSEPIAECPKIKGLLAFYPERVDDIFKKIISHPGRPINGIPLVGTYRCALATLKKVHPHIFFGKIIARRKTRFEQKMRALTLGNCLSRQNNTHMT
ncbi:MAG: DUF427 domain-containing protein, partial [Nitrospinaceae bacterium]|nr:DUF427 domain-containing protein [Nitrospinaceae bacterium]